MVVGLRYLAYDTVIFRNITIPQKYTFHEIWTIESGSIHINESWSFVKSNLSPCMRD